MRKRIIVLCSAALYSSMSCANNVSINWWFDGTLYNSSICEPGGDVALPTAPTAPGPGYVFVGWEVQTYDFSTLPSSGQGTNYYAKGKNTDGTTSCFKNSLTATTCSSVPTEVRQFTWKTVFSFGDIYGDSVCSTTNGTVSSAGVPNESVNGAHCWCRATGYKPNDNGPGYDPTSLRAWIYQGNFNQSSNCLISCSVYCAKSVYEGNTFYRAVLQNAIQ